MRYGRLIKRVFFACLCVGALMQRHTAAAKLKEVTSTITETIETSLVDWQPPVL